MTRWLPMLVIALGAGCGPKAKAPVIPTAPQVTIPKTWEGVSFDSELKSLGTDFKEATDAGQNCGDLLALEPVAMTGKLTDDQITCLDHALRLSQKQTTKDTISRVLMADAWAKHDMHRWEGAVRRHLEQIDRSDPDLSYLFSVYLSKTGWPDAYEAIRYAEIALENKDKWGPEVHAERVGTLMKVRALAAQDLWHHYEDEMLRNRTKETSDKVDQWRANTKAMAREWLAWANDAGQDVVVPYQICVSAAGTVDYCDVGFPAETSRDGNTAAAD